MTYVSKGKKLKKDCKQFKISQRELSKQLGINEHVLRVVLNGDSILEKCTIFFDMTRIRRRIDRERERRNKKSK